MCECGKDQRFAVVTLLMLMRGFWGLGLNIHEETERGDNESIKKAAKGTLGASAGCGCA